MVSSSFAGPYGYWRGPRVGFGVYINPFPIVVGTPYYAPTYYGPTYYGHSYYYGSPYYSYPREVVIQSPTVIYSPPSYSTAPATTSTYNLYEAQPSAPALNGNEWLYCDQPDGFYPAIKDCPGGWRKISK
ncbi:hypothetical protein ACO0KY_08375 [Undibacterium sp. Dicai25W]|uniref:hypothetical protein n=1 Tax=Undibacterium sp. Dicai25W TaxID=3413034 RepID=UPI003BF06448